MRRAFRWITAILVSGLSLTGADTPPTLPSLVSGRPPLLDAAFQAFLDEQQRWACTETHASLGPDGTPRRVSIIRVDPSLPYAGQFVPVKLGDQEPTAKNRRDWAERGEQLAQRRLQAREELATIPREQDFHLRILNEDVTPELERAVVVVQDDATVTYEIPLRKKGGPEAPVFDAFQLTARVNKQRRQFEQATFRQRGQMRVAAGKYSDGLIEVEFGTPDPKFPAVPVKISNRSTNKPMFGAPVVSHTVTVRTDLRRVTPYDERFQVKLAPLRLIEF